jgi:energy-coupling factor transport system permease protein
MPASFAVESPEDRGGLVYRLDVRTKVGVSLLASLAVIFLKAPAALGLLAVTSGLYALSLRRWRLLIIVYVLVLLMWGSAVGMMAGLHAAWDKAPALSLEKLAPPFLRTAVMVNVALALALSVRMQALLATLKALRLPFWLYVPLAVMLRFLPTFIDDVRQVYECIRSRGYRLSPLSVLTAPRLTLRLMLTPLIFRALRSADELGIAAELKGLGSEARMTPLKVSRFGRADLVMAGVTLLMLAASAVLQITSPSGGGGML